MAYTSPQQGDFTAFDDSDDEDENGNYVIQVRTALLEAKKGAITAVGEIGAHCGAAFVPFLDQTLTLLQKNASNWHPLIKAEVAEALPSMVLPIVSAEHGGSIEWTKGDIGGANPMSQATTAVVQVVLKELITLMKDDDKTTVGKACEALQSVFELCGPFSLAIVAHDCLEGVHDLLNKSAPCQAIEDDEEDYDDDDDDHDSFMISVCDLVGAIARVMGTHFVQYLPQFLPAICSFAKASRPSSDRSMAMGCLGELAQELEGGIKEYWKSVFLPAILAGVSDEDNNVKRNAAFCAGVSCEGLGPFVAGDYMQILNGVGQIFGIDPSSDAAAACIDNASACVARMIMACPNSVPISQVLPVVLRVLPLKSDMTENETVFKCLFGLLQSNNPDAIACKAEIKRVFLDACEDESKVDDELKEKIKLALPSLG